MVGAKLLDWAKGRGSRDADFAELLAARRAWAYRLALKIVDNAEEAEDVAQTALLKAWNKAGSLQDPDLLQAWLRKIVVRAALNHLRAAKPTESLVEDAGVSEPTEDALQVRRTLARLAPDQRILLALVLGDGLSYRETAEALDLPEGTVSSRLNAAKAAFRRLWEED